ncbi:DUF1684 domain-containing protein [Cytophagaceae bacterium ABcell3]|nr:DUF1684 domain-containing protein [Cytophagaceae bacterium ABcell3]
MKAPFNINSKSILTGLIGLVVIMIFVSLFSTEQTEDPEAYIESVQAFRKEKDKYFGRDKDSPIENQAEFEGLNYYDPDPSYKTTASLELLTGDEQVISIKRSDGKKEDFIKYAYASFELNEQPARVLLLKRTGNEVDTTMLFLPFTDKTSGEDTYGGGRYLDLKYDNEEEIEIDFNLAYNPYCVYNIRYSCPLPPEGNFIDQEIRAGEKNYKAYE